MEQLIDTTDETFMPANYITIINSNWENETFKNHSAQKSLIILINILKLHVSA